MTPADCPKCTLFQFLYRWLLTNSLFWIFLAIIVTYAFKCAPSRPIDSEKDKAGIRQLKWLEPHLKTQAQVKMWFALHVLLLFIELLEGYWIIQAWGHWVLGYWNWRLKYCQWGKQFWQFVMLVVLGVLGVGLLFAGAVLVGTALNALVELWACEVQGKGEGVEKPSEGDGEKELLQAEDKKI